jgi:phosphoribosylanthranilate isomerase
MVTLKVCGATTPHHVRMLAEAGADLVGLWHGVPGGPHELPVSGVAALARAAGQTGRLRPVLVTFLSDTAALLDVVARTGIRWLQLHAYQPPAVVRALKAGGPPDLAVVKVLHVLGGDCVERRFVGAYARAGVDVFLLDAATEDGRVGSTGLRLGGAAVAGLADELPRPFLLAGGVSAVRWADDAAVARHPRFLGVDVDSGARDPGGQLAAGRVSAIRRAWDGELVGATAGAGAGASAGVEVTA